MLPISQKNALCIRLAHHFDNNELQTILFELNIDLGHVAHYTPLELAQRLVHHADQQGLIDRLLDLASALNTQVGDWFASLPAAENKYSTMASFINQGVVIMNDRAVHLHGNNTVGVLNTGDNVHFEMDTQTINTLPASVDDNTEEPSNKT